MNEVDIRLAQKSTQLHCNSIQICSTHLHFLNFYVRPCPHGNKLIMSLIKQPSLSKKHSQLRQQSQEAASYKRTDIRFEKVMVNRALKRT